LVAEDNPFKAAWASFQAISTEDSPVVEAYIAVASEEGTVQVVAIGSWLDCECPQLARQSITTSFTLKD